MTSPPSLNPEESLEDFRKQFDGLEFVNKFDPKNPFVIAPTTPPDVGCEITIEKLLKTLEESEGGDVLFQAIKELT